MPAFGKLAARAAALGPPNTPALCALRLSGKTFESSPQRKITVAKTPSPSNEKRLDFLAATHLHFF
jgi:hypothetical protein